MAKDTALSKAYQNVFKSKDGMLVLDDLIKRNKVFQSSYVRGDTHETAFYEGKRRAILEIMSRVTAKAATEQVTEYLATGSIEEVLQDD